SEVGQVDRGAVDAAGRTGLDQVAGRVAPDAQLAARHQDRHLVIDQASPHAGGRDRACARAGGQGVAGAALPDLDPDARAVDDLEQLHVGALGEGLVALDVGAELNASVVGDGLAEDHAVRVPDRHQHRLDAAGRRVQVDAVGLAFEAGGEVGGPKRSLPDVDLAHP